MKEKLLNFAWNAAFVAGSVLVVIGVGQIYRPAGWIVGGLEIAVISFLGGFDSARAPKDKEEE